jgi:hypothetical protein
MGAQCPPHEFIRIDIGMSLYREFPVISALAPYIECGWVLSPQPSENSESINRIFPDGATDIVIASVEGAVAYRPTTAFRLIPGGVSMLGFRIRTGAAAAVLRVAPGELPPSPVSIRMLWGRQGSEVEERLLGESRPAIRAALLQRLLTRRLADPG